MGYDIGFAEEGANPVELEAALERRAAMGPITMGVGVGDHFLAYKSGRNTRTTVLLCPPTAKALKSRIPLPTILMPPIVPPLELSASAFGRQ